MKPFFLLLGLLFGLGIGKWGDIPFCLGLAALESFFLFLIYKKGFLGIHLLGLGIGLGFALLSHVSFGRVASPYYLVIARGNGYVHLASLFHNYYYEDKEGLYEIGDILRIEGMPLPYKANTYESRFSFVSYLKDYGITEALLGKASFLFRGWIRFGKAEKAFLSAFDTESAAILGKILFGASSGDSKALSVSSDLDLFYLLSAGGFLFGGMLRLVERFFREFFGKKTGKAVALGIGALFLPLGLRKIGILRVLVTRLLELVFFKKNPARLSILSLSGTVLLAINPFFAYQSGYLLGYGLGFLFVFLSPLLKQMKGMKRKALSFGLLRLFLLPVHLLSGHLHILSPLFGLVLLPLAMLTMGLGYLSFISVPFTHVLGGLTSALSSCLFFFDRIDIAIMFPSFDAIGALLYFLIYLLCLYLEEAGAKWFRNAAIFGGIALYAVSLLPIHYGFTSEVAFINVGQGDAILLRDHDKVVMVDTGGVSSFDMAEESLIPFLLKRRIYHIDVLILTHDDFDHVGAASSLQSKFRVGCYITEATAFPLKVGRMEFCNYNVYSYTEDNDKSLVLGVAVGGRRYLLMGDAPEEVEKRIITDHPDLRCDILKAGHHGSKTSTAEEFLDCVQPKEAIISCGAKNRYGHPSQEVLSRLQSRNITVRRTDEEGSIVYVGFG